jgi:hypothetical protein
MADTRTKLTSKESIRVMNDVTEFVKIQLGYPVVDVEITDDQIRRITEMVLTKMSQFSCILLHETVAVIAANGEYSSYNAKIDAKKFKYRISYIYDILKSRGNNDIMTGTSDIAGIPMGWALRNGDSTLNDYSNLVNNITNLYNERVLTTRLLGAMKDNISYDYFKDDETIWLDVGYPSCRSVTIEYIPILTIDNLDVVERTPDAYQILVSLVTAYTMISLGRARGKYTTSNYDWSIQSSELVESGKNLLDQLDKLLRQCYSHNIID